MGDASIEAWLRNFGRVSTRYGYRRRLLRFLEAEGLSAERALEEAKADPFGFHDRLKRYCEGVRERGCSAGYVATVYNAVRSFCAWNEVELGKRPRGLRTVATYEGDRVLRQDEVRRMVDLAPCLRDKALIAFLAQGGQRGGLLMALRVGDISLEGEVSIVRVRGQMLDYSGVNRNKGANRYRFAVGGDARQYLELMLDERRRDGEKVDRNSWLFRSYSKANSDGRPVKVARASRGLPITESAMNKRVERVAEKAGIQAVQVTRIGRKRHEVHAHIFRRYWKHQLRQAGVDPDLREYMMGHVPRHGGAYDKFGDDEIRREYLKAEPYLSLVPRSRIPDALVDAAVRSFRREIEAYGVDADRAILERIVKQRPELFRLMGIGRSDLDLEEKARELVEKAFELITQEEQLNLLREAVEEVSKE